MSFVEIHYTRPPFRLTIFRQRVVHRSADCIVTYMERAALSAPLRVRDAHVLEPGAPVVWFTFPDAWHDIGRFHTSDGTFTGYYANILTPVEFITPLQWETTDLFLDVWLDDAGIEVLDEAELASAAAAGFVSVEQDARARAEAAALLEAAGRGAWPPPICAAWTLERVLESLGSNGTPARGPV